jgi:hypothetical protein
MQPPKNHTQNRYLKLVNQKTMPQRTTPLFPNTLALEQPRRIVVQVDNAGIELKTIAGACVIFSAYNALFCNSHSFNVIIIGGEKIE